MTESHNPEGVCPRNESERIEKITQAMLEEHQIVGEDAPSRAGRAMNQNWNRLAALSRQRTKEAQERFLIRNDFQNAFAMARNDEEAMKIAAITEMSLDSDW